MKSGIMKWRLALWNKKNWEKTCNKLYLKLLWKEEQNEVMLNGDDSDELNYFTI